MILVDNINLLQEINPNILEKVKFYEDVENRVTFEIEETRKGNKTLTIIRDDKRTYLHSKYDPLREAETIIEPYKEIDKDTNIVFYGTGLGYHIKLMLEKHPNNKYYIYDPIPELMYSFLSNQNLKNFSKNKLTGIDIEKSDASNSISRFVDLNLEKFIIVELPSHKHNFSNEYKEFKEMFLRGIKDKKISLTTNYLFQKRWIINSMKNLKFVLSTPNIIMGKKNKFNGKTAIIVSAGPSLNEEIENLRYIKDNKLAYIFSVGSAINSLVHHGIYPDAACTYDPTAHNQNVFKTICENKIKEIPMIFGSTVGYETLEDYPGNMYHMITSQDTISKYYLNINREGKNGISIIQDAPSIAVVTMQLLYELGFSYIILVGQNFGYKGKERYSEGIPYDSEVSEEEMEKGLWVKDVSGNEILTNETFNSMRKQMESYINQLPNIKTINTTKGGAHIEGTKFIELEEVIDMKLKQKMVEEDWLEGNNKSYDIEYLEKQARRMDKAYNRALKTNKDYNDILCKIEKSINNKDFLKAENLYVKLDNELRRIENNDYYKTFILPMNRVQYKILANSIDELNEISDPYKKGRKIIDSFRNFIDICIEDIEMIEPIYDEMKENIIKLFNTKGEG